MRATHNTSGQTIVELIVVIGVAMVIVTALIVSSTASLRSSQYSKAKSQATKYAQEGMGLPVHFAIKAGIHFLAWAIRRRAKFGAWIVQRPGRQPWVGTAR
ncbi:hypothetical protein HY411_03030 [Candidatus Gottesmanbacteria bacterium]|nr:hypothetical protein [Candidatus Gottesmanbacteria bacterium]